MMIKLLSTGDIIDTKNRDTSSIVDDIANCIKAATPDTFFHVHQITGMYSMRVALRIIDSIRVASGVICVDINVPTWLEVKNWMLNDGIYDAIYGHIDDMLFMYDWGGIGNDV